VSRDPRLYLSDIVDACRRIERIAEGRDDGLLVSDEIVRDAILYNIVVIGEAASRLPPQVHAEFPAIPWSRIRAMRNVLAHEYFGVGRTAATPALQAARPVTRPRKPAAEPPLPGRRQAAPASRRRSPSWA